MRHLNGRGDPPQKETYYFADIVALLLENDASVTFADRSGKTPLDRADDVKVPEEIRKLLRRKQVLIDAIFRHATFDDQ